MNLAILISGGGSTAEAVIKSSQGGELKNLITPSVVISSDPQAGGVEKAKALGVPVEIIDRNNFSSQTEFGLNILKICQQYNVEIISQNGWLTLTPKNVIEQFNQKIFNQHPGPLDPGRDDFGGKGMFGARVTAARIIYCLLTQDLHPWTEATTHMVTEEFDKGAIIRKETLELPIIQEKITFEELQHNTSLINCIIDMTKQVQKELLPIEHKNVIATLKDFATNNVALFTRTERLVGEMHLPTLHNSKELAIQLFPNG